MVVDDFPPLMCGIGQYAACLAHSLSLNDVAVTIVTKRVDGCPEVQERDGVRIHRVVRGWFLSDLKYILALLRELGPDAILHIQYASCSSYYRRLMINFLPVVLRVLQPTRRVVLTLHGFHEQRMRWRVRVAPMLIASHVRIFLQRKDHAMVTRWLRSTLFHSVLMPQAPGIPTIDMTDRVRTETRESLGFNIRDRVVVFFGGIRSDKGLDELIEAVRTVRSREPSVRLLIVGVLEAHPRFDVEYKTRLQEMLNRATGENWATFVSAPVTESVPMLLRAADLAVFPFTMGASENRSSMLAALVNGLPVLTTRGPSTPKRFEEEYGVKTVPARDHTKLVSAIEELLCRPVALSDLQQRAAAAVRRLSWDAIGRHTAAVYRSTLGRKDAECVDTR
jgi:glycosyltransferase involved in cell wall biosynthesis